MFADARGYAQRGSRGLIGDHIAITGPTRHTDGSLTLDSADARDLLELLEGSARAIREFGDLRHRLSEVINDPSHRSVTVPLNLGRSLDERTQGEAAGHQSGANASGKGLLTAGVSQEVDQSNDRTTAWTEDRLHPGSPRPALETVRRSG